MTNRIAIPLADTSWSTLKALRKNPERFSRAGRLAIEREWHRRLETTYFWMQLSALFLQLPSWFSDRFVWQFAFIVGIGALAIFHALRMYHTTRLEAVNEVIDAYTDEVLQKLRESLEEDLFDE